MCSQVRRHDAHHRQAGPSHPSDRGGAAPSAPPAAPPPAAGRAPPEAPRSKAASGALRRPPPWIVAVALAVVVAGGGAVYLLADTSTRPPSVSSPPPSLSGTPTGTADRRTVGAAQLRASQPAHRPPPPWRAGTPRRRRLRSAPKPPPTSSVRCSWPARWSWSGSLLLDRPWSAAAGRPLRTAGNPCGSWATRHCPPRTARGLRSERRTFWC